MKRIIAGMRNWPFFSGLNYPHPHRSLLLLALLWLAGSSSNLRAADTNFTRRVEFLEPQRTVYYLESASATTNATPAKSALPPSKDSWTRAISAKGSADTVQFGSRVVLKVKPGVELSSIIAGQGLEISRQLPEGIVILQATNSEAAIQAAAALATNAHVEISYPVTKRRAKKMGRYSAKPNDTYFSDLWHLENRDSNGTPLGIDLNVREAWSVTKGSNVIVAVADDGIDMKHPDLAGNVTNAPNHDFDNTANDGSPHGSDNNHGTAVAGLIGAVGSNSVGVSGVAPQITMASWVMWSPEGYIVSDETLMDLFQYKSNVVAVQNHSWGSAGGTIGTMDALSNVGVSNAVNYGRGGKGVVIVRSAGNMRIGGGYDSFNNQIPSMGANDDAYGNDPRVIAVAAARFDGLFCSYSSQGASILVGAPSGDPDEYGNEDPNAPNLMTTDRTGTAGYNSSSSGAGSSYCFGNSGFNGTSASAPEISGVAALILAANTNLTYRDVQQVLLQSAHYSTTADGDIHTNAAGFVISHNLGYGVPDAGFAVALAKHWSNRPTATEIKVAASSALPTITSQALQVVCAGDGITSDLESIACWPGMGVHANTTTAALPLVYVGQATEPISEDLTGKAALIQRGVNYFEEKIKFAVAAGASFVVIFNNTSATDKIPMQTPFAAIPAVFINKESGDALSEFVTAHPNTTAQIAYNPAVATFDVTDTLACEHVGLKITTTATARGNLRIVLVSPSGTRSVMQAVNTDGYPAPDSYIYWSTHHFYESSYGQWRLEIGNELTADSFDVTEAQLIVKGVAIKDTDHDGLDDDWEMAKFGKLNYGPADDPDGDGYCNAREQCLDTHPDKYDPIMGSDISFWDSTHLRVAIPTKPDKAYTLHSTANLGGASTTLTNTVSHLPGVSVVVPYQAGSNGFYYTSPAQ